MKHAFAILVAAALFIGCTQEIQKPEGPEKPSNKPPSIALYVSPTTGVVNETEITADLDGSADDSKIATSICDWGDGSADTSTSGALIFRHVYGSTGLFTILAEIVDDSGAVSYDDRPVLIVIGPINKRPVITMDVNPITGIVGQTWIAYAATASDSDGVITNTLWEFGDGSSAYALTTAHVYSKTGLYMVVFSATDNDGAITTDRRYVWIGPVDSGGDGNTAIVDTTCWSMKQCLTVTLTHPYKTGIMNNPAGLSNVVLTVIENHGKPDMLYGFTLVQGNTRIPFVIPDHKPNSNHADTVRVQLPQEVILEANQKFELTYQDGPNSNSVTLINVEGCTYTPK
ncbi:MAG: PKD domain-containing protein [Patescibacteria group bacterium]|jgi:hypothetical protein